MALVTIGSSDIQLQPDFVVSRTDDGSVLRCSYKGSLSAIADYNSSTAYPGAWFSESRIPDIPDNLYLITESELQSVNGGEAILSVTAVYFYREELTWVSVNKPLEAHPHVVSRAIDKDDLDRVEVALMATTKAERDARYAAIVSGYAKKLYELKVKRIDSWELYYPVLITETVVPADSNNPIVPVMGYQVVDYATVDGYFSTLSPPQNDAFGNAFTYVQSPDIIKYGGGETQIARKRSTFTGYIGVESWMYDPTSNFPSA